MEELTTIEIKDNRFMKELLSDMDRMFVQMVREFVDKEIMPIRREIDPDTRQNYKLISELHKKMVAMGWQKAAFPVEYGGMNITALLPFCLAVEEFVRGEGGAICAPGGGTWALRPAMIAGNKAVLDEFAPKFCGEDVYIGCFAITEPAGGCNIENIDMRGRGIATRATLDGDEWVINGPKMWCTNSGIADVYNVVCTTDPALGDEGIAMIYVPSPIEGLTFGKFEDKAGFRGSRECAFWFDNVRVPKTWRAAGPGRDAELFHENLTFARAFSAAWGVGVAQGAFEEVLAFTKDRLAAGKPIRQHTVCANMLADMAIGIQVGRDAYVNAAYQFDHPETYGPTHSNYILARCSLAKMYCCDMGVMVTNRAMELMGSYGYVTDHNVEKYWRDIKIVQLWEGGAQLGRLDVARGYYPYDQFYPNEFYERVQQLKK